MKLTNCIPNPFTSLRSLVFVASLSLSLSGTNSCNLASTRKWENQKNALEQATKNTYWKISSASSA